jgi:hypothetical protein
MLEGRASWEGLGIEIGCLTDEGFRSVTVFGSGAAIWNRERQFNASREVIQTILEAFQSVDFGTLKETYGGNDNASASLYAMKRSPSAIKVTCRVGITIDDVSKQVTQFEKGEQSKELRELATEVLALCEEPARSGVTAKTLTDALQMIANGALAPETLEILVHRKIERPEGEEGHGWILRVEASVATARTYVSSTELGDPVRMNLGRKELADLAQLLDDNRLEELPVNLYARHYTDLAVTILNHEKKIQSRQFARMTPETHGEAQARFDQILTRLRELHHRLEGK